MAPVVRLVVAGSRTITHYALFRQWMDQAVQRVMDDYGISRDQIIIVTGRAGSGPDDMAYHYARWDRGMTWEDYFADWDHHGKSAGFIRNSAMAKVSQVALVIYDGRSKGTQHMLEQCSKNVPLSLVYLLKPEDQPFIGDFFELKDTL